MHTQKYEMRNREKWTFQHMLHTKDSPFLMTHKPKVKVQKSIVHVNKLKYNIYKYNIYYMCKYIIYMCNKDESKGQINSNILQ